ncbi:MAG: sigma 54-interacting transcriptional regulator [Myxococcota bacterium]
MAGETSNDGTLPVRSGGLPIKLLKANVVSGPDAGITATARNDRLTIGTATGNDLVLTDPTVSRFHLELRRSQGKVLASDLSSTNGTTVGDVALGPGSVYVRSGAQFQIGNTTIEVADGQIVMMERGESKLGELHGKSRVMHQLFSMVSTVAKSQVAVLVLGESGTGKELVARALHEGSLRADGPFVTVDCAAIASSLFASELFGHERGAFTGAHRQHIGAFERAHGGTLFLDEVGELAAEHQAQLLGALERRRVRRVGGTDDFPVDVRVVSATHRDLRAGVNEGSFRMDLFYRIAVTHLVIPPLRERREDIPALIELFLKAEGSSKTAEQLFGAEALSRLRRYRWPGNVRELRNVVRGTLATGAAAQFESAAPVDPNVDEGIDDVLEHSYRDAKRATIDLFERRYLSKLLEKSEGNIRKASRIAHMDRGYLIELLRRHGLKR